LCFFFPKKNEFLHSKLRSCIETQNFFDYRASFDADQDFRQYFLNCALRVRKRTLNESPKNQFSDFEMENRRDFSKMTTDSNSESKITQKRQKKILISAQILKSSPKNHLHSHISTSFLHLIPQKGVRSVFFVDITQETSKRTKALKN